VRWVRRLLVAAATLVLGAAVALCCVALHGYAWGLALGLLTTAATLVALPGGWARLPFAVGWCALVIESSARRPEGDVLVASDWQGRMLFWSFVVVLIGGMVGARRHAPPPDAPPVEEEPRSR
jgi:hypothetical protein